MADEDEDVPQETPEGSDGPAEEASEDAMNPEESERQSEAAATAAESGESEPAEAGAAGREVPAIHGVSLEASAILGTALMPVSQLLKMGRGAVVELDKSIGDTIDISINDQLVARGEVMIKDDRLCIEITEMVKRVSS